MRLGFNKSFNHFASKKRFHSVSTIDNLMQNTKSESKAISFLRTLKANSSSADKRSKNKNESPISEDIRQRHQHFRKMLVSLEQRLISNKIGGVLDYQQLTDPSYSSQNDAPSKNPQLPTLYQKLLLYKQSMQSPNG